MAQSQAGFPPLFALANDTAELLSGAGNRRNMISVLEFHGKGWG